MSRFTFSRPVSLLCVSLWAAGFRPNSARAEPFETPPAPSAEADEAPVVVIEVGAEETEPEEAPPAGAPASGEAPGDENAESEPPEVQVLGTRVSRTAGSAHVIKGAQLERFEYDDPHAVMAQVPGVYVRQEDGVGLRPNIGIRGGNPDRSKKLTLMEDGILFGPAPYSAPAAYYFPIMTRMAQVLVIKGPSAIAYGPHTVGGAVNLLTRDIPAVPQGFLDLGVGQYGYGKFHGVFGASQEQFGFLVEGVHLHNDGFKELPSGADTGSTRNEWMVKSSYILDPRARATHVIELKLGYSDEVSNETYLGLTDADFRSDPLRRYPASALDQMKNHRTSIALSHTFDAPDAGFRIVTTAYRHQFARVWRKLNRFRGTALASVLDDPEDPLNAEFYAVLTGEADTGGESDTLLIGPNDRAFVSQGVQSASSLGFSTGPFSHRVETGVRLHHDSIGRKHSEDAFLMQSGELVPEGTPTTVTTANFAESDVVAVHLVDAVSLGDLTLTPGVRAEVIRSSLRDDLENTRSQTVMQAVMPGIGAFYGLTANLGILGGVYRGFSPPPPGSGEHVEPEYSVNYEAGSRIVFERGRAELIGFFNDYSNLTDICTFSSGCLNEDLDRQFDAGQARIFGLEAYADYELAVGAFKVPLTASYTLTRAVFDNSFDSSDPIYGQVEKGDELPYVPRHQVAATLAVENDRWGSAVAVHYVSRMREQAGQEPLREVRSTDEQLAVDLGAKLTLLPELQLYANARNLLNARDIVSRRPYGARPNAPRWIQAGLKLAF